MRRQLAVLTLSVTVAASSSGQSVLGTYTMTPAQGRGTITLVLRKDAQGKIGGSFSGNGASYTVQGDMQGDGVAGMMSGGGLRSYFEAQRDGASLHLIVADIGADGKPDYVPARELILAAATDAPMPAMAQAGAGNPLAAGSVSAVDKFAGTFTSTDVTLVLNKEAAGYAGTIRYRGADYPATARRTGETLAGSFNAGGQNYDFTIAAAGDGKFVNLITGGTTFMLARGGASATAGSSANPLSGDPAAANAPASSLAKTSQDQQIVRILTSTAWCSFSYSGSSTYSGTSSGTTRTSRAVFRPDGTASESQNGESVNTGSAGAAWGSSGGGRQGRWRIENGLLMLSADGIQWVPQQLKIADNGNGYPIVTAGGKEYMVCR